MNRPFEHQAVPIVVRVAQAVGITATAFIAGQQAATTYFYVPAILQSPAPLLAKQWRQVWDKAATIMPAATLALAGVFAFLTSREDRGTTRFKLYLASTLLLPSVIPYTIILLGPVNKKLVEKSDNLAKTSITDATAEAGVSKEETVHALVDRWATLNLGRGVITAVAAFTAMWASLNPVEVVAATGVQIATGANRIS